jgi:hypothetical protein
MELKIKDTGETILNISRKIGYKLQYYPEDNQYSIVKKMSEGDYPRFHIYIKRDEENKKLLFNLHLDQKNPSYKNSEAHNHSGEYEGEIIEKEARRIKNILQNGKPDDPPETYIF